MPYHYDVFISYSSNDKAWAEKLFAALEGRGLHPFLDKQRLEIGKPWERQLADALKNSQHLVVLWSNNAKQSDWVQRELALFDTINASSQVQQRLIFINLEGQNAAYAAWQMVDDLNAAKAYTNGIDKLDAHLWQEATKKVAQAIRSDDASIAIPAVILTMTRSDLDALQSSTWQTLQQDLGLTKEVLAQCYGDRRTDWHPFGSPDGVLRILEKLLDQINLAVKNPRFRWDLVEDDFWADSDAARRYTANLLVAPISLVVIDPIALHDQKVYRRLMIVQDCFENEKSAIMVLPPFTMPTPSRNLRRLIKDLGQPVFDPYYEPPVPPKSKEFAQCGVSLGDELDVKRLLLSSLGRCVLGMQPSNNPAYVRV